MSIAKVHGPPVLRRRDVAWEEYRRLRDDPAHDKARMTYLDGELTIVSPPNRDDRNSRRLLTCVTTVACAWNVDFLMIGATTLRRPGPGPKLGIGKEPDEGFYFGADEARVRGNEDLDLTVDPPPTLAIEVDILADTPNGRPTHAEILPAYARIGVPEVWIYKDRPGRLRFFRLEGKSYREVDRSVALPRLTPTLVLEALAARSGGEGDLAWFRWLEAWARALPEPPPAGPDSE